MKWNPFTNSSRSKRKGVPLFVPAEWDALISQIDWHRGVPPLIKELNRLQEEDVALYEQTTKQIYDYFEDRLKRGRIALAKTGQDYDAERKPIDTVIIHHSSQHPGMTKERLSGIDLFRLYAPQYAAKEPVRGVYSGHFRLGFQVFWPYHWIIRHDGRTERLLLDKETGWQAGDWDVNCRSIAILLDNDYENSEPSSVELAAIARIIKDNYPQVPRENILGHCEVNKKTFCPSKLFLSDESTSRTGWKKKLLDLMV